MMGERPEMDEIARREQEGTETKAKAERLIAELTESGWLKPGESATAEILPDGRLKVVTKIVAADAANPDAPVDDLLFKGLQAQGYEVAVDPVFDDAYEVVGMEYIAKKH